MHTVLYLSAPVFQKKNSLKYADVSATKTTSHVNHDVLSVNQQYYFVVNYHGDSNTVDYLSQDAEDAVSYSQVKKD